MQRNPAAERQELDRRVAGETLCTLLTRTAAEHPDVEALRWKSGDGWRALTYRQYAEQVYDAARGLESLGFGRGEFALIMARNRPEHLVADLAIVHAGGTPVSIYNTLASEQIAYIAGHCEATVAIVEDEAFLAKFRAAWGRLPRLRRVVLIDGAADGRVVTWRSVLEAGRGAGSGAVEAASQVKPDQLANLVYTSGTTGPPKAVMYSHYNVLWTVESSRGVLPGLGPGKRLLSYLPYAHIAERLVSHYLALRSAATVSFCPDPTQLAGYLVEVRPQLFVGVPRVWEKLATGIEMAISAEPDQQRKAAVQQALQIGREIASREQKGEQLRPDLQAKAAAMAPVLAAIRAKVGLDACEYPITSTAPIAPSVMEFFYGLGLNLLEVWGQSEVTGPATATRPEHLKIGTVGYAYPGMEVKLAEDGEILVRGGNVMQGYYKEPEKTAETIDAEGWVHTGDVGTMDADGFLTIIDRKKELIITSGGKNISPANLESLLKRHPLVAQACAIGDRRPYITALVVLDHEVARAWARARGIEAQGVAELARHPAVQAEIEKVVAEVNEHVSRVEQIKRFTVLPVEWTAESEELTPTLKLKRRVLLEKYADVIDGMYSSREQAPAGVA
jgi:long-chain acyl-CoA synthetase